MADIPELKDITYMPSRIAHTILTQPNPTSRSDYVQVTNAIQVSRVGSAPLLPMLEGDDIALQTKMATTTSIDPRHARLKVTITKLQSQIGEKGRELEVLCEEFSSRKSIGEAGTTTITTKISAGSEASQLRNADQEAVTQQAQAVVSRHIKLLHRYNEIKDVGMGLLGMIADIEGRRLGEVMADRDVSEKD